ncbi:MAG: CDP-alcohol phosphatidyltransferase family protein [Bacteroidaceae bacterium]|nr:CDP-alcohol phosphatidyltransferase family protein [Bacteroidaceae bacterium]
MSKDNEALKATFKSKDTEEWLDIVFTRRVGYVIARAANSVDMHPNTITIISIFLGVLAGFCWWHEGIGWALLGVIMLMSANFLDSADGQLARMSGKKTLWGRILDGFAGDVWFASIYIFMLIRLTFAPMPWGDGQIWGIWIWVLEFFAALVSHPRQAALADYYRNVYLLFHGDNSELNDSRELAAQQKQTLWKDRWFWKIWLFVYQIYTSGQERQTPSFQRFRAALKSRYDGADQQELGHGAGVASKSCSAEVIPPEIAQEFCRRTYHLLKWTNISTFNTRAIFLYFSMLIGHPWIYLVFEITVMNVIWLGMRRSHEKICRDMLENLK